MFSSWGDWWTFASLTWLCILPAALIHQYISNRKRKKQ